MSTHFEDEWAYPCSGPTPGMTPGVGATGTQRPDDGVRKMLHHSAKNAPRLDLEGLVEHLKHLPILRNTQGQTRGVRHQLECVASVVSNIPHAIGILMDAQSPPPCVPTIFKGSVSVRIQP